MGGVNVDFHAFTDLRFERLAQLLKLADADHARSKVEWLWLDCTTRGEIELPQWLVEKRLGPDGPSALIESELARWARGRGDSKTRTLYIRGANERTRWFQGLRGQASNGGKARAANASRTAGRFTSNTAGRFTSNTADSNTSPLLPSALLPSAPLCSEEEDQKKNSATPTASGDSLPLQAFKAKVDRATRQRKPRPTQATDLERTSAMVVLEKLGKRNGVRYTGTDEHVRLITHHLRNGVSEWDLRLVVGYCAEALEWQQDPDMSKFLRPETLFGPKTLSKYLDPARAWAAQHDVKQPAVEAAS